MTVREIISYLLPHVVTAGAYSAQIQKRVATHDAKEGDTPFHQALSQLFLSETAREWFSALYALKASRSLSESVGLGTFAPATAELKA
jgi:hypothetical protein